jgi:hypothetical protein
VKAGRIRRLCSYRGKKEKKREVHSLSMAQLNTLQQNNNSGSSTKSNNTKKELTGIRHSASPPLLRRVEKEKGGV